MASGRVIIVVSCLVTCLAVVSGLKGCSNFGHSCFGAHGKRTDPSEGGVAPYPLPYADTGTDGGPDTYDARIRQEISGQQLSEFLKKWLAALRMREESSP